MNIQFNTMVKNEELLLKEVLPIWQKYPVDKFVFYNDNSTDNTEEVIRSILEPERYEIINDHLPKFHEAKQRDSMLTYSRFDDADYVLSIDADELLSANLANDLGYFLKNYETTDIWLFWYNVVNESLNYRRNDPQYVNNYRSFILPMKHTGNFDLSQWKYHTPRVPYVNLPKQVTKNYGIIHLQAMNTEFYSCKQLWYKHHEFVEYGHSVEEINRRYDSATNLLDFKEVETPDKIRGNIAFRSEIFVDILKQKRYKDYIVKNINHNLITFGKEYI